MLSTFSFAQTRTVNAAIDASKTSAPISKYIYGQFLEHIGGIVNNNIWAEMLDDRKFYYPINSHPPAQPAGPSTDASLCATGCRSVTDQFISMDTDHPYTGDHTPSVKLGGKRGTRIPSNLVLQFAKARPTPAASFLRALARP